MDKIELQIKQDESTVYNCGEKLELVANKHIVTKEEVLSQLPAKEVVKSNMMDIAGDMSI